MGVVTILSGIMLIISWIGLLYISNEIQNLEKLITFSKYFNVSKETIETTNLNISKNKKYKIYAEYCIVFFCNIYFHFL